MSAYANVLSVIAHLYCQKMLKHLNFRKRVEKVSKRNKISQIISLQITKMCYNMSYQMKVTYQ
jgi:hypothetical protein